MHFATSWCVACSAAAHEDTEQNGACVACASKAVATRAPLERRTENGERTGNGDAPKAGARAFDPRPQDENREQRTGTGPQLVGCANLSHIRPTHPRNHDANQPLIIYQ